MKKFPHSEIFNWISDKPVSTQTVQRGPKHHKPKLSSPKKKSLCLQYSTSWLQKFLYQTGKRPPRSLKTKSRSESNVPATPKINLKEIIEKRKSLRKVNIKVYH